MTNTDTYERKDFDDFLVGDETPKDTPETRAFTATAPEWITNYDASDIVID